MHPQAQPDSIVPRDFLKFGDNAVMLCGDVVILVGLGFLGQLGGVGRRNPGAIQKESNERRINRTSSNDPTTCPP